MKRIISVLLVIVLFVACVSCSPQQSVVIDDGGNTQSQTGNRSGTVDGPYETSGIKFTLDAVTGYVDTSDFTLDIPEDGKEYVIFWLTGVNVSDEDQYINMFYEASLCDGAEIDPEFVMFNLEGESFWGDCLVGGEHSGYIAYQAPIGWQTIEFKYKPFVGDEITLTATSADVA